MTAPVLVPQPQPESSTREYQTSDVRLASFILVSGRLNYQGVRIVDPRTQRGVFTFSDPKNLARTLKLEYLAGGLAPAPALFESLKMLKQDLRVAQSSNSKGTHTAHEHDAFED